MGLRVMNEAAASEQSDGLAHVGLHKPLTGSFTLKWEALEGSEQGCHMT